MTILQTFLFSLAEFALLWCLADWLQERFGP